MGQKVHPTGIRLGVVKDHNSVWYADSKTYAQNLINDLEVREYILKKLDAASVSRVKIERPAQTARITIFTARPGIVIGKKGEDVDGLRKDLSAKMGVPVHINIEEIRKPDVDARLVAQNVAQQLERRVMFRRAMKRVVQNAMRQGAEGIKVQVSGRLGGAEIARTEWYREGRVPLHTLRADIDYATYEAHTTYGVIGVKVWIFKGEVIGEGERGNALYIVTQGTVSVVRESEGNNQHLADLTVGDFFGEAAMLGDDVRTATVRATAPSTLLRLVRRDVVKLAELYPEVAKSLEEVRSARSAAS